MFGAKAIGASDLGCGGGIPDLRIAEAGAGLVEPEAGVEVLSDFLGAASLAAIDIQDGEEESSRPLEILNLMRGLWETV